MYAFASTLQSVALLASLLGGGLALHDIWRGRADMLALIEKMHWVITGALTLASALLLHALYWHDFSVQYVASYTDLILPVFYRLTAFWAGQQGSLLFWALAVALGGTLFALTRAWRSLALETRLWHWVFFYAIMAFFTLILTTWSNPFVLQTPPRDGNGLNPLLQHPGMIFHPPLLFLGYGGFTVPACLALAQTLSGKRGTERAWFQLTRPFIILAWLFLSAGIALGAWWAYMELGWGGYWAWDPVENASLLPWLIGTAALHTLIIEDRCGKLGRVNVVMMVLTTVSAFFATYLVRSGVVESVHAFGDGSVGTPLTLFVLSGLLVAFWTACWAKGEGRPLAGPNSREGMLTLLAWTMLALALIILTATLWPQLSKLWSSAPRGLDAAFYNRVCLPLGALVVMIMAVCPWLRLSGGIRNKNALVGTAVCSLVGAAVVWAAGYRQPTALVATAASFGLVCNAILLLKNPSVLRSPPTLGALGAHLGMALITIGIAFSGPYAEDGDFMLEKGQSGRIRGYTATLLDVRDGRGPGYDYLAARVQIQEGEKILGLVTPERRIYDKFGNMQFSEVDVIPGLGDEIYASMLGLDTGNLVHVRISVKPLVNWLWIGCAMLCLLPLLCLWRSASAPSKDIKQSARNRPC
ncbi:MAG: cytochrome c biogenesis protein CcsA [Desulfovibrio sp.]|jgi:cytochrome c-type biogenesis protein CcmF|nr:cytochrome c biogenesis protein CcsA [Desulfovibrio sp.]